MKRSKENICSSTFDTILLCFETIVPTILAYPILYLLQVCYGHIMFYVQRVHFLQIKNSIQGLQNQMLSIFMLFVVMTTLAQQYVPMFVTQRDLYEAREHPSRTFSWFAFIAAQITSEILIKLQLLPFPTLCGTILLVCIVMLEMPLNNVEH